MADNMLRIAGRSAEGYAKAIKTTEDGELIVRCNKNSRLPISGKISVSTPFEIPFISNGNGIMVALDGPITGDLYNMTYEIKIGDSWKPWFTGDGDPVETIVQLNKVYGPIRGFPTFDGGRLRLSGGSLPPLGENLAKNKTYASTNPGSLVANAFDESTLTQWTTADYAFDNQWIAVDLGVLQKVSAMAYYGKSSSSTFKDFKLFGTNEAIDATSNYWEELTSGKIERDNTMQYFNFSEAEYRYYRIAFFSNHGAGLACAVQDFRLFYVEYDKYDITVKGIDL